jgi:predicted O-linked N-acetylglucosamine transferase (SPINDLY family)
LKWPAAAVSLLEVVVSEHLHMQMLLPEPQLAQLIRQDEIDILVELTGV